jgi:hypothetical protein
MPRMQRGILIEYCDNSSEPIGHPNSLVGERRAAQHEVAKRKGGPTSLVCSAREVGPALGRGGALGRSTARYGHSVQETGRTAARRPAPAILAT